MKILIVEDDYQMLMSIVDALVDDKYVIENDLISLGYSINF